MSWKSFLICARAKFLVHHLRLIEGLGLRAIPCLWYGIPEMTKNRCMKSAGADPCEGAKPGSRVLSTQRGKDDTYPRGVLQIDSAALNPDELVYHGLERPLAEEGGHGVVPPVKHQHQGRGFARSGTVVEEFPLLAARQVVQCFGQLLAHLGAALVPALAKRVNNGGGGGGLISRTWCFERSDIKIWWRGA